MAEAEVNTIQEIEILLENATELLKDDVEILTQLNGVDDVARDMEQKLDTVLNDLDRLLAQLDSGDMTEPTLDSHEKPRIEIESRGNYVSTSVVRLGC